MSIVDTKIAESKQEFKTAIDKLIKQVVLSIRFDLDANGNIVSSQENLKKINDLDTVFKQALIDSGYSEAVELFLDKDAEIIIEVLGG